MIWVVMNYFFRYFVGEKMAINCTSAATLPPANLTWYINQKLVRKPHLIFDYSLHHSRFLSTRPHPTQ
jgi:hypothetical protein